MEARVRKYTSPYRDVIRAKIVLLAAEGLGNDLIAARFDTPRQIVSKWRHGFFEDRMPGLEEEPRGGRQPAFPPSVVVDVKRLACELPSHSEVPLARFTIPELHREVLARGIVAQISGVTLWRWLSAGALQPWRHRSWIFPRDPQFAEKAGRVLDLYARTWDGTALEPDEFVVSADEKPSLQAQTDRSKSRPSSQSGC